MSTLPHDSFDAKLPNVSYDAPMDANSFTSEMHLSDVRFLCHYDESMAHHHTIGLEYVMYTNSYSLQIDPIRRLQIFMVLVESNIPEFFISQLEGGCFGTYGLLNSTTMCRFRSIGCSKNANCWTRE